MKLFLFLAMALPFLLVTKTAAQTDVKEKLKVLENNILQSHFTTPIASQDQATADDLELQLSIALDRLIGFVILQKTSKDNTFDANIKPYIEENALLFNASSTDFTDEEELIFDSFLKVFQWQKTPRIVQWYQEFISKNQEDISEMNSLKTVLSCIESTYHFTTKHYLVEPNKSIAAKITQEFESYNTVHWKVFAMQPNALLFWLIATIVWDFPDKE